MGCTHGHEEPCTECTRADTIAQLRAQLAEARRFGEEAAKKYNALLESRVLTCVYCGHVYDKGTPAAQSEELTRHIEHCEKHPLAAARKERDEAREQLVAARRRVEELSGVVCRYAFTVFAECRSCGAGPGDEHSPNCKVHAALDGGKG